MVSWSGHIVPFIVTVAIWFIATGLIAWADNRGSATSRHSIAIGLIAAVVSNLAVHWRTRSSLDDTLDVFPCHGVGGMVGMVLTGVFAQESGLITGQWQTFGVHLLALVFVSVLPSPAPVTLMVEAVSAAGSCGPAAWRSISTKRWWRNCKSVCRPRIVM